MDGGPSSLHIIYEITISQLLVITKGRVRPLLASIMPLSS
jgi:hypothetical protein